MQGDLITKIATDANLLHRRVWCRICGNTQVVANGLKNGWPKCCGFTMTIDPPEADRSPSPTEGDGNG